MLFHRRVDVVEIVCCGGVSLSRDTGYLLWIYTALRRYTSPGGRRYLRTLRTLVLVLESLAWRLEAWREGRLTSLSRELVHSGSYRLAAIGVAQAWRYLLGRILIDVCRSITRTLIERLLGNIGLLKIVVCMSVLFLARSTCSGRITTYPHLPHLGSQSAHSSLVGHSWLWLRGEVPRTLSCRRLTWCTSISCLLPRSTSVCCATTITI